MNRRTFLAAAAGALALPRATPAADTVVIEDWSGHTVGARGLPAGWQRQRWGSPAYDFTVEEQDGSKVLHLRSANDSSNISREIKGKVNLEETPILEWRWKVVTLPQGADSRKKQTDDQAAQLYVTWRRFPEAVRSRIVGYIWDTGAPAGATVKSEKTATVTYVILRSGPAELGRWITERRNVREDFKRIHGEEPEEPAILSIGIDSDDVKGVAEAYVGSIAFRKP